MKDNWKRYLVYFSRFTGGAAMATIIFAGLSHLSAQANFVGLYPVLMSFFASLFGDIVVVPLLERLISGDLNDDELENAIKQLGAKLDEIDFRQKERSIESFDAQHELLSEIQRLCTNQDIFA